MSSTFVVRTLIHDNRFPLNDGDYYYKECAINALFPEIEADAYEKAFLEEL